MYHIFAIFANIKFLTSKIKSTVLLILSEKIQRDQHQVLQVSFKEKIEHGYIENNKETDEEEEEIIEIYIKMR